MLKWTDLVTRLRRKWLLYVGQDQDLLDSAESIEILVGSLGELVTLKEMKESIELEKRRKKPVMSVQELEDTTLDYEKRKEPAWKRAKDVLRQVGVGE